MKIKTKRVYETAEHGDGLRVLVDRLWPRGVAKGAVDLWLKDIAPSDVLRRWFDHIPERWTAFRAKYRKELSKNPQALRTLESAANGKTVTLLYGARDTKRNQAVVIADYLERLRAKKAKENA